MSQTHESVSAQNFADFAWTFPICMCKLDISCFWHYFSFSFWHLFILMRCTFIVLNISCANSSILNFHRAKNVFVSKYLQNTIKTKKLVKINNLFVCFPYLICLLSQSNRDVFMYLKSLVYFIESLNCFIGGFYDLWLLCRVIRLECVVYLSVCRKHQPTLNMLSLLCWQHFIRAVSYTWWNRVGCFLVLLPYL